MVEGELTECSEGAMELRAEVEWLTSNLESSNYNLSIQTRVVGELEAEVEQWKEAQHAQLAAYETANRDRLESQVEVERLRAFVQRVALYSNDAWLAREADELAPGASL